METKTITKEMILFLKNEIKRLSSIQRHNKETCKHNARMYSKIVFDGIQKAIDEGKLKKEYNFGGIWWCVHTPIGEELEFKYNKQKKEFIEFNCGFEYNKWSYTTKDILTSLYVVYNKLKGKKRLHITRKKKASKNYDWLVGKWMERVESSFKETEDAH